MTNRGAGCWEIRLSGSKRGWSATLDMDEILWHRWETRRQTENTNFILCLGESPAYSNTVQRISPKGSERPDPTLYGPRIATRCSGGLTIVEIQHAAQPFTALNRSCRESDNVRRLQ